mgnify:CR=1 FL=1
MNPGQSFDGPTPAPKPKQRRTRIRNTKVDVGKAYAMKQRGLTYHEIGERMGACKSTIHVALQRFQQLLPDPGITKHYNDHRANVLTAVEHALVEDMLDPERRAKASLNNTAYAFQQVANLRRLEQGKATSHVAILQLAASQADTKDDGSE